MTDTEMMIALAERSDAEHRKIGATDVSHSCNQAKYEAVGEVELTIGCYPVVSDINEDRRAYQRINTSLMCDCCGITRDFVVLFPDNVSLADMYNEKIVIMDWSVKTDAKVSDAPYIGECKMS